VQPRAEMVHWLFAAGILFIGMCLLCEAIVGREVWQMRPWRKYLWPGVAFGLGEQAQPDEQDARREGPVDHLSVRQHPAPRDRREVAGRRAE